MVRYGSLAKGLLYAPTQTMRQQVLPLLHFVPDVPLLNVVKQLPHNNRVNRDAFGVVLLRMCVHRCALPFTLGAHDQPRMVLRN